MAETYLGDYPQPLPGMRRPRSLAQLATHGPQLPPWMLLSLHKPATASSGGANASAATDEDIRTWWAAESAAPGEWYSVELGGPHTVHAVQINFADEGCSILGGRPKASDAYRYFLEWRPAAGSSSGGGGSAGGGSGGGGSGGGGGGGSGGSGGGWLPVPGLNFSASTRDRPHEYVELAVPLRRAAALRLTGLHQPNPNPSP